MLACPMGGPIFSTFTASGVRYSHHNFPTRVNCSQLQPVRFASRPQFALSPLAALFPTAQPVPAGPVPRQSAPSPPERIPFPSGEDLHRDTPVIVLPRAGPNLYGAEPHDSPLLSHTHTRAPAHKSRTHLHSKSPDSVEPPPSYSAASSGENRVLCLVFLAVKTATHHHHQPSLPSFPPHPPIQAAIVHLSSSPSRFPIPPPASSPAQERPKCQCNNASQGYLIRAKRKQRKEQKSPKDRKQSKYLVQSMTCGASAESPTRRSAPRARACPFSPAAVAARLSGGNVSIFRRGGRGFDGVRASRVGWWSLRLRRRGCVTDRLVLGPNGCGCL